MIPILIAFAGVVLESFILPIYGVDILVYYAILICWTVCKYYHTIHMLTVTTFGHLIYFFWSLGTLALTMGMKMNYMLPYEIRERSR